jgi:hypothetical protein
MGKTAKASVTFDGFSGYYGFMSSYNGTKSGGGFDWSDFYYFTSEGVNAYYPGETTGYNQDLHGSGEGFTAATANYYHGHGQGYIESPSKETFNLKSGEFASAWDSSIEVYFISFKGSKEYKSVEVTLSQTPTKVDFAKYGKDFQKITGLEIYSTWKGHVSSQYGAGYQIVVDNLKATWNGKLPGAHHNSAHHVAHGVLGAMAAHSHGAAGLSSVGGHGSAGTGEHGAGFHSVITSLDGALGHHSGGSLTSEFTLEHFGS